MAGELKKMKSWFDSNKLTLNLNKTKFIIFGNRTYNTQKRLTIDNIEIERVNEIKFLGVIIDSKLSWKSHIQYITAKIAKSIAILHKVKHLINQSSLYTLYCSFILPYITYCVEVWGNTYKTNTETGFKLQKKAIRIINNRTNREPSNPLFIKLKALKFMDMVNLKTLLIMHKANQNQLPLGIQKLFQKRENKHNLRGLCFFKKQPVRTTTKTHCVSVKGVNLWNKCSEKMKTCRSFKQFKQIYINLTLSRYKSEMEANLN